MNEHSGVWLIFNSITLTTEDKNIITLGNWLTNKHMNSAQSLLKKQNNNVAGLYFTLLLHAVTTPVTAPGALQSMHCRGNHWIVTTTIGCPTGQVKVFDSSLDPTTMEVIAKIFGAVLVISLSGPKQAGSNDCGVFAIATATSLTYGIDPNQICYQQQSLRSHLLDCFENLFVKPFPIM